MPEYLVGLDVGTTTISGAVIDINNKRAVDYYTTPNDSWISSSMEDIFEQDAEKIYERVKSILDEIRSKYGNIEAVGITGQMHGVLYVDTEGMAVSPFMIWQDRRAGRIADGTGTYCDKIYELCGERVAVGYGLATHYYNVCNSLIPQAASAICNITDYLVMRLTGTCEPIMHSSIAGSIGFYDIENIQFKGELISRLDMDCVKLPEVTDDYKIVGNYLGIPISVGIGDNQASFLGTVDDLQNSILVNIGTGSQVSTVTNMCKTDSEELEIRPLLKGKNLMCGCAISGGASYAMLERFFRTFCGDTPQYDRMNELAAIAYNSGVKPLEVNTFFKGKRSNPDAKGSIMGITDHNFTPESLILGFIYGMCRELYDFLGEKAEGKSKLIASGNGVQKNPILRKVLGDIFGMPVNLSKSKEEASIGAALFAGVASGVLTSENDFAQFIVFEE